MISTMLQKARDYEKRAAAAIPAEKRPVFHLTAQAGWMNDPNGFSRHGNQYHMFYQYYPYTSKWNSMHWGHAVSEDLLHWKHLPAALAPDMEYDRDGCFSGSAVTMEDGRQLLMYTGVRVEPCISEDRPDLTEREIQTQCIAVGDGIDFTKYEGNPVLTVRDLPEGSSPFDFRDPHIEKRQDGTYECYIASNDLHDGGGQILLFESEDGFRWHFVKVLVKNRGRFGTMWECPDFFSLDGFRVLLTSPQDMLPKGLEYHSGNNTLCLLGIYDEEMRTFHELLDQSIDYGIDFYAPQTVLTPDGRRVMIGWMQNWDAVTIREPQAPWAGQMSLPRELNIRKGRLYQRPIRELDLLRCNEVVYRDIVMGADTEENYVTDDAGFLELAGVRGRVLDLQLRLRPQESSMYRLFEMNFAQDEEFYTTLRFVPEDRTLQIDRKFSGSRRAIIHQRRCFIDTDVRDLNLRIILDRSSVEVFIEDGRKVMTATMYTPLSANRITFHSEGAVRMDLTKYDLKF